MHPYFDLTGKVAIVTSCASELGRQMAAGLAEAGASIVGIDMQDMQVAEELVTSYGAGFEAVQADLANCDVEKLVQDIAARYGKIDILIDYVNELGNAGEPEDLSWEEYERVIAYNQNAVAKVAFAVYKQMITQHNGGKMVIVSSAFADRPGGNRIAYTTSKNAVVGLAKSLSIAGAKHKVWVNVMMPSMFETERVRALGAEDYDAMMEIVQVRQSIKTLAKPEKVRGLTVFLSSRASDYTVGQVFRMDGGLTTRT